jgi:hypothetical protein
MKKTSAAIILALLSLTTSLTAHAVNEFAHPVIIPPLYFGDVSRCQMLRIESTANRGGQAYVQTGVGWVIRGDEGLRVLTPAHVISGADQVTGSCLGKSFRLRLLGKTETKDLALLAIQEPTGNSLFPMIELKAKNTTNVKTSDHFINSFEAVIENQIYSDYAVPEEIRGKGPAIYRSYEKDTKMIGIMHFQKGVNSLVAETLAIRPGYSGAPAMVDVALSYDSANAPRGYRRLENLATMGFLLGMLNKVEINGSRSLGVSLPEILEILPALWNSTSTDRDVYVDLKKSTMRFRYQNAVVENELQRSQELVVKNKDGSETIYSEVCVDANLESSAWVSAKDRAKSITQSNKGGDYGEGGGGSASLKNSILMTSVILNIFSLDDGNLTSYKRIGSCERVMLKDSAGRFYDSFNINGRLTKTTNLAELYDALSELNTPGPKPTDNGTCRPYRLELMDGAVTKYKDEDGNATAYFRSENVAITDERQKTKIPVNSEDPRFMDFSGFMRCFGNTGLQEVYFRNVTYTFHGVFGDPKQAQGLIQLEGPRKKCSLDISAENYQKANRWKHQIRSKYMDIDVNIGNAGRILGIKFLKISKECHLNRLQITGQDILMGEENFSTMEEIANSQAPNSEIRSEFGP